MYMSFPWANALNRNSSYCLQTCNEFAAQQVVVILSNENFWFVRKFASRFVADQISG